MAKRRTAQFKLPQGQPQPTVPSVMNSFVGGLKTEFTGLNFPENAATATSNCTFTRVGNITRRNGIDFESNFLPVGIPTANAPISTFIWHNAGGLGNNELYVAQVGSLLYFFSITNATPASPLSNQYITQIDLSPFKVTVAAVTSECQYAAGNGYLIVYNPQCDPVYCTYDGNVSVVPNRITVQIRDFIGLNDGLAANQRPGSLTPEHNYNLNNQGWVGSGTSVSISILTITSNSLLTISSPGIYTFNVSSGYTIPAHSPVTVYEGTVTLCATGTVSSYGGTSLALNLNNIISPNTASIWTISVSVQIVTSTPLVGTWFADIGNYPSNSDVWWTFKDTTDTFNPTLTINNVSLDQGLAPKGFYILNAFDQERTIVSGVGGITPVSATARPRTGTWFQGRAWYTGVDASQPSAGDAAFYTWTENIYFSQVITDVSKFGQCYENNDPTSQDLNTLLPTDGGVINIQGCGSIYKLFPVQNGLIVFAANGIWFITGSQGIGFSADDYTVTKISGEHAISSTSFVDVNGYPMFWNQDGIYAVMPGQSYTSGQRSLEVKNLTLPTIKQFYMNIPLASKATARGSYNHVTGVVQWLYKSTSETGLSNRYTFDSVLNFLTYTDAFYNWTISNTPQVLGVDYIDFTGSSPSTVPAPIFKYFTAINSSTVTFSEERDNVNWVDWFSTGTPDNYTSSFTTGYTLKGQGQRKAQIEYIYVYSEIPTSGYTFQGIWDYAGSNLSNRFSTIQVVNNNLPLYNKGIRKLRVRGDGYAYQLNFSSLPGQPFNIAGWSVLHTIGIS